MQEVGFIVERQLLEDIIEDNITGCRASLWEVNVILAETRIWIIGSSEKCSQSIDNSCFADIIRANDNV